ncbi:hypothetical protein GW534_02085 [Bacillus sp. P1(2020)]|uniref:Uncharacterized protein n=1 Tax=Pallidibacillus pasinlerensis TaxID=2703818 RepID=A0ABW9ZZH2_9BACI|nr:hypothetical protein [Pallidibacillus pasinlerensis]
MKMEFDIKRMRKIEQQINEIPNFNVLMAEILAMIFPVKMDNTTPVIPRLRIHNICSLASTVYLGPWKSPLI